MCKCKCEHKSLKCVCCDAAVAPYQFCSECNWQEDSSLEKTSDGQHYSSANGKTVERHKVLNLAECPHCNETIEWEYNDKGAGVDYLLGYCQCSEYGNWIDKNGMLLYSLSINHKRSLKWIIY